VTHSVSSFFSRTDRERSSSEWFGHGFASVVVAALSVALAPVVARASCDVIPGVSQAFLTDGGIVDRPFAAPGDWVAVSPACGETGVGPFDANAEAYVVTIAFVHADGQSSHLITIANDCDALVADGEACEASSDGTTKWNCIEANTASPTDLFLDVRERDGQGVLRFRFPDTDAYVGAEDDGINLAGPARITVTRDGEPLPCETSEQACSETSGLSACIDRLYANAGGCAKAPETFFSSFTALPEPNQYQNLCVAPVPPCDPDAGQLRVVTDAEGNILVPMNWQGVLVDGALPFARLLRGGIFLRAFAGREVALSVPSNEFLQSFTYTGALLPPVFEPQVDPTSDETLSLFGTADAPATVLRVARRSPGFRQCAGGPRDMLACGTTAECPQGTCGEGKCVDGANKDTSCKRDDDCPDSECGPSLFEFRDRRFEGAGPIVVERFVTAGDPVVVGGACQVGGELIGACGSDADCGAQGVCVSFGYAADHPVALDGITQTSGTNSFVVSEGLDFVDLNGDGDTKDEVVLLSDRATGRSNDIGRDGFPGRVVTRLRPDRFTFPAVSGEGDVVAFLEPEPLQNECPALLDCDQNADGDAVDTLLRVYSVSDDGAVDLLAGQSVAADAAPVIGGRSFAVSAGLAFYRRSEWANVPYEVRCASCTVADCTGDEPSLSADGRYVTYTDADRTGWMLDLRTGIRSIVSRGLNDEVVRVGEESSAGGLTIDETGQFVVFGSVGQGVLLRDVVGGVSQRVDVSSAGLVANGRSAAATISSGGRFVAFESDANNLVENDDNGFTDVFVHDSHLLATTRVSVASDGSQASGNGLGTALGSFGTFISQDGRYVAFSSDGVGLVASDPDCTPLVRAYVHDRDTDEDGVFDEPGAISTTAAEGNGGSECGSLAWSLDPSISAGGASVAFRSGNSNLVAGDTNDGFDLFLRSLTTGEIRRLNVTSDGDEVSSGSGSNFPSVAVSGSRFLSRESRYAAFQQSCCELGSSFDPQSTGQSIYLHDSLTGFSRRVDETADLGSIASNSYIPVVAGSAAIVAFESQFSDFPNPRCPAPLKFGSHAMVAQPASTNAGDDLNGDGDLLDTILEVRELCLDAEACVPGAPLSLGPVTAAAVVGDSVAMLVPEAEITQPNGDGTDRNADGDATDQVVHLYRHATTSEPINLARAAVEVKISESFVGGLVSEDADGGESLNGDTDTSDTVLEVYGPLGAGADWSNTGKAADAFSFAGSIVVFSVPEAGQGHGSLNGDADALDRVAHTYDPIENVSQNLGIAVVDFVAGDRLVALRVSESGQSASLNDDVDRDDDVLFVFDTDSRTLMSTGQTMVPCTLEACDRRQPYRVLGRTVRFLTLESDQGEDLNGDGDVSDMVVQIFNVDVGQGEAGSTYGAFSEGLYHPTRTARMRSGVAAGAITTVSSVSAGVCSDTGEGCTTNEDCSPTADCFVPPGRCVKAIGTPCIPPEEEDDSSSGCAPLEFCRPLSDTPSAGTCFEVETDELGEPVTCQTEAQCSTGTACEDAGDGLQRVAHALLSDEGDVAYVSAGECIEHTDQHCSEGAQCPASLTCNGAGVCERSHGVCLDDDDCPPLSICERRAVLASADDRDGDELPDPFDNCPNDANGDQADRDTDGVGDACTRVCGDGFVVSPEECDDGDTEGGPGEFCRATCLRTPCGQPVNRDAPKPSASDALFALRSAVGLSECDNRVCDVDGSGTIAATDARAILLSAVGLGELSGCRYLVVPS